MGVYNEMVENFSDRVKEIFFYSERLARDNKHMYINPLHVALAIIEHRSKNIDLILKSINLKVESTLEKISDILSKIPQISSKIDEVIIDSETQKLIACSLDLSRENGDKYLTEEFLLLGFTYQNFKVSDI